MSECLKCGGTMHEHSGLSFEGEVRDETVSFVMAGLKCEACGRQTVPGSEMQEFMRRAADAYRVRHRLLTSETIRSRRNALGMTQEEFAEWLPAGVASVRRWELGAVQDDAMDELIRLKTDPDEAREAAKVTKQLLGHRTSPGKARQTLRSIRERSRAKSGKSTAKRKASPSRRPRKAAVAKRRRAAK